MNKKCVVLLVVVCFLSKELFGFGLDELTSAVGDPQKKVASAAVAKKRKLTGAVSDQQRGLTRTVNAKQERLTGAAARKAGITRDVFINTLDRLLDDLRYIISINGDAKSIKGLIDRKSVV